MKRTFYRDYGLPTGVFVLLSAVGCEAAKDGRPGPVGDAGAAGVEGSAGASGADGASGEAGTGGTDASTDADGDGVHWTVDCDDGDASVGEASAFHMDRDGDGYGHPDVVLMLCDAETGWVTDATDCDDLTATTHPDGDEVCDGEDNNCDGRVDDDDPTVDLGTGAELYIDADGDGWGDGALPTVRACAAGDGLAVLPGDCDEADPAVSPDAEEICGNGIDDDCSEDAAGCGIRDGLAAQATWAGTAASGFGLDLAGAGDLDGDGDDELIVGALYDSTAATTAGAASVLEGDAGLNGVLSADYTWTGSTATATFGAAVTGLGDVDGDGYDDVMVGSLDDNGVYLFYGGAALAGGDATAQADVVFPVDNSDAFGVAVHPLGDITGDGRPDFGIAEDKCGPLSSYWWPGCVYVYAGGASLDASLDDTDAMMVFQGEYGDYDDFGVDPGSVATGDWDGDGWADLAVGAPGHDATASNQGVLYVIDGPLTAYAGQTVSCDDSAWTEVLGTGSADALGSAVAALGDWSGDGYADLAVSAPGESSEDTDAGAVYVHFGSVSGLAGRTTAEDAELVIFGESAYQGVGQSVAGADLDGDGAPELVLGAEGSAYTGAVYVFGRTAGGSYVASDADARLAGSAPYDRFGARLTHGDFNGDGVQDLAVGSVSVDLVSLFFGESQ